MATKKRDSKRKRGHVFDYHFTQPPMADYDTPDHPFDSVKWVKRDAIIQGEDKVIFEQKGVEFPEDWSQMAINIVASKYFSGILGTSEREYSLKQLIGRVVDTITEWGLKGGYFSDGDSALVFKHELAYVLLHQRAAFNSPVWFNIGVEGVKQQASACFVNSVEDDMESIMKLATTEVMLFKRGSGTGTNFSALRSSKENLSTGGVSSGPVSFMKGYDAFAGIIRSGGTTRRAAKMVILDADHPDILEFINCKRHEEQKARTLIEAGYPDDYQGPAYNSLSYQNANHSVRLSDDFMRAVENDQEWQTTARKDGRVMETYKARNIFRNIAEVAWDCGDPGVQFDTTINDWHTCPNTGKINTSNPCVTGETLVATQHGLRRIDSLVGTNPGIVGLDGEIHPASKVFVTGQKPVYELQTRSGYNLRLTANHRVWTVNRGDVPASELMQDDIIQLSPIPSGQTEMSHDRALYLGLMMGDGCITGETATLTMHLESEMAIVEEAAQTVNDIKKEGATNGHGMRPSKATSPQGVARLSTGSKTVRDFLFTYGNFDRGSHNKSFTDEIFKLDKSAQADVLRGLFTADGTVANYGEKSHYVSLDSTSLPLLQQAQMMLLSFGIKSKLYQNRRSEKSMSNFLPDGSGGYKYYGVQQYHSLRISKRGRVLFAQHIGFHPLSHKQALLTDMNAKITTYSEPLSDAFKSLTLLGTETVYDLTEPETSHFVANGLMVHNCAEYLFLDDSACNLLSLNLLKFLKDDQSFDVDSFQSAVDVCITAMDILVGNAEYPTPEITDNSRRFRPLGMGYTNLGALLMTLGLPYDSDIGRDYTAAITALMTSRAYRMSVYMAKNMGPFDGFIENAEPCLAVLEKHHSAFRNLEPKDELFNIVEATEDNFQQVIELSQEYGVRNAQVSVMAPTGTISFFMDADTTGCEPDFSLVKTKKLVGGGTLRMVNGSVSNALNRLGYSEGDIKDIVNHLEKEENIETAPHLKEEHLSVFDCAIAPNGGQRFISPMGHLKMLSAMQPFLSGGISKTCNLPEDTTVEEIQDIYMKGWKMGIKCVAVYRDNSKVQPLGNKEQKREKTESGPVRRRLPDDRAALNHKFSINGQEGYINVGLYEDGAPGEVFITMAKQGSTVNGMMDTVATLISLCLQYGVPIESLITKFKGVTFQPQGFTQNEKIRITSSVVDYIFRHFENKFIEDEEEMEETSVSAITKKVKVETKERYDGDVCSRCGATAVRRGKGPCSDCDNCGDSIGACGA